jgi:hypothetical protein
MEPVGPPWNTPGVLPDCKPCDPRNIASSSATIVIQEKNGVKLQDRPRATITQHNRCKIAISSLRGFERHGCQRHLSRTSRHEGTFCAPASFATSPWVLSGISTECSRCEWP